MYWSLPFTFICIVQSVYLASITLLSSPYVVAFCVVIVVDLSIHFGPLKILTIHKNHLPIVAGALFGAFLACRLNKSRQQVANSARLGLKR